MEGYRADAQEAPVIAIAGRPFKDREELVGHIRSIQDRDAQIAPALPHAVKF